MRRNGVCFYGRSDDYSGQSRSRTERTGRRGVRMFFKAAVRMQGLPFSTALNSSAPVNDFSMDGGMTISGRHFSAEETAAFTEWARNTLLYDEPNDMNDDETIVMLPLKVDRFSFLRKATHLLHSIK